MNSTTPVQAITLLNRLTAMVKRIVNPPNLNYRGNAADYVETHEALDEAQYCNGTHGGYLVTVVADAGWMSASSSPA